jgi:hypothetical protein
MMTTMKNQHFAEEEDVSRVLAVFDNTAGPIQQSSLRDFLSSFERAYLESVDNWPEKLIWRQFYRILDRFLAATNFRTWVLCDYQQLWYGLPMANLLDDLVMDEWIERAVAFRLQKMGERIASSPDRSTAVESSLKHLLLQIEMKSIRENRWQQFYSRVSQFQRPGLVDWPNCRYDTELFGKRLGDMLQAFVVGGGLTQEAETTLLRLFESEFLQTGRCDEKFAQIHLRPVEVNYISHSWRTFDDLVRHFEPTWNLSSYRSHLLGRRSSYLVDRLVNLAALGERKAELVKTELHVLSLGAKSTHLPLLRTKIREWEATFITSEPLKWRQFYLCVSDLLPNSTTYSEKPSGRPLYNLLKQCEDSGVLSKDLSVELKQQAESHPDDSTYIKKALKLMAERCYLQQRQDEYLTWLRQFKSETDEGRRQMMVNTASSWSGFTRNLVKRKKPEKVDEARGDLDWYVSELAGWLIPEFLDNLPLHLAQYSHRVLYSDPIAHAEVIIKLRQQYLGLNLQLKLERIDSMFKQKSQDRKQRKLLSSLQKHCTVPVAGGENFDSTVRLFAIAYGRSGRTKTFSEIVKNFSLSCSR